MFVSRETFDETKNVSSPKCRRRWPLRANEFSSDCSNSSQETKHKKIFRSQSSTIVDLFVARLFYVWFFSQANIRTTKRESEKRWRREKIWGEVGEEENQESTTVSSRSKDSSNLMKWIRSMEKKMKKFKKRIGRERRKGKRKLYS